MRLFPLALLGGGAYLLGRKLAAQPYDLGGKIVLITGASRGLGLILARQLAQKGAKLAILARDPEELRRAEEELADHGAQVLALVCDVTNGDEVVSTVERVVSHYGRLDVLINNAGVITVGPLESMTLEDYQQAMNVNFYGPLHFMLAAQGIMKAQGGGRILNVSSIGGKVAVPHLLPYSASKFALTGLSEGSRSELARDNIVVTTVCPGLIRTGSARNANFKGRYQQEYQWFALSDNLPGLSQSAEACAREIVEALRWGKAEIVTSIPAQLLATFHALFPGQSANLNALMNFFLPAPGGIGPQSRKGYQAETKLTQSLPTKQKAELANNER